MSDNSAFAEDPSPVKKESVMDWLAKAHDQIAEIYGRLERGEISDTEAEQEGELILRVKHGEGPAIGLIKPAS